MGTGGIIAPPDGYWAAIQEVLKKHDILLISDEVVCGFGRLGSKFGAQHYGIQPDLITVAKGLTSAYAPLSGVIVGERVWDVIDKGSQEYGAMGHGWTYSGHPICAAAALANLDILERENLTQNAADVGALSAGATARGVRPRIRSSAKCAARACWRRSNSWRTRKAASPSTPR